jgi:hypothetical protein
MLERTKQAFRRPIPVSLSDEARLKLEALSTMLQEPASLVLERAVLAYITSLPLADRDLVKSLATRARVSLSTQSTVSTSGDIRSSRTVKGTEFIYKGSIEDRIEVLFENAPPLRITRENIDRIREEIVSRKGPGLMGAIFSPLMPNSIGEAIQTKYRLTPISLSYVIPLLRERGEVRAFKEGRTWYVEAVASPPTGEP